MNDKITTTDWGMIVNYPDLGVMACTMQELLAQSLLAVRAWITQWSWKLAKQLLRECLGIPKTTYRRMNSMLNIVNCRGVKAMESMPLLPGLRSGVSGTEVLR